MEAAAAAFSFAAATVGMINDINDLWTSQGRDAGAYVSLFLNSYSFAASEINFFRAFYREENAPQDPLTATVKRLGLFSSTTPINLTTALVEGAKWVVATRALGKLTGTYALKGAVAVLAYVSTIQAGVRLSNDYFLPDLD